MRTGWVTLSAAAALGVVALVPVIPRALNHQRGADGMTANATPEAAFGPIADTQGDAAVARTDIPVSSSLATVPPTTVDVATRVLQPGAALAPASTTAAAATANPPVPTSAIGTRALRLISYPWTKLGYQITFGGPRAGFFGLTDCHSRHIDIYVTSGQSAAEVAYVTAFEIGHAIDCTNQVAGHQAQWSVLRGFRVRGAWFPSCSCSEDSFASGDFAEVFARWQVGAVYPWRSTLARPPTAAQLAALIPLFG